MPEGEDGCAQKRHRARENRYDNGARKKREGTRNSYIVLEADQRRSRDVQTLVFVVYLDRMSSTMFAVRIAVFCATPFPRSLPVVNLPPLPPPQRLPLSAPPVTHRPLSPVEQGGSEPGILPVAVGSLPRARPLSRQGHLRGKRLSSANSHRLWFLPVPPGSPRVLEMLTYAWWRRSAIKATWTMAREVPDGCAKLCRIR